MPSEYTITSSAMATPPNDDRKQRWSKEFTAKEEQELRGTASVGWMAENAEYALEGNKRILEKRQKERGNIAENTAAYLEERKEKSKNFKAAIPVPKEATSSTTYSSSSGTDKKKKFIPHEGPSRFGPPKKAPERSESADRK